MSHYHPFHVVVHHDLHEHAVGVQRHQAHVEGSGNGKRGAVDPLAAHVVQRWFVRVRVSDHRRREGETQRLQEGRVDGGECGRDAEASRHREDVAERVGRSLWVKRLCLEYLEVEGNRIEQVGLVELGIHE